MSTPPDGGPVRAGRARPSDATRKRLLEAGRTMVMERGLASTLPVRVADVAASVGHTTGAAYQIWPSQAEFQRALSEHMLSSSSWPNLAPLVATAERLAAAGTTADELVRSTANAFFDELVKLPEFYVHLHFWAVGFHDESLHPWMRRGYDDVHERLKVSLGLLLDGIGLQMAPPYSIDQFTTTITALAEGLALRHLVDAGQAGAQFAFESHDGRVRDWSLFACAVDAIVAAYTQPV